MDLIIRIGNFFKCLSVYYYKNKRYWSWVKILNFNIIINIKIYLLIEKFMVKKVNLVFVYVRKY